MPVGPMRKKDLLPGGGCLLVRIYLTEAVKSPLYIGIRDNLSLSENPDQAHYFGVVDRVVFEKKDEIAIYGPTFKVV